MNISKQNKQLLISHVFKDLKLISEANNTDHWTKKHKRKQEIAWRIRDFFRDIKLLPLPVLVKITRIAPRSLDLIENLPMSVKHVIDTIADILIPGLKPGRADGSKEINWEIYQEKGRPKQHALKIEIFGYIS